MELDAQVITFAVTIATGALVGLFFDFYRIAYGLLRPRAILTNFTDLMFWLAATVIIFGALLLCNWGELRAYVFIGLFGGALLYFRLVSGLVRMGILKILRITYLVMLWINKGLSLVLVRPVMWLAALLIKPFRITKQKTAAWYRKITKPPDENIPPNQ